VKSPWDHRNAFGQLGPAIKKRLLFWEKGGRESVNLRRQKPRSTEVGQSGRCSKEGEESSVIGPRRPGEGGRPARHPRPTEKEKKRKALIAGAGSMKRNHALHVGKKERRGRKALCLTASTGPEESFLRKGRRGITDLRVRS